MSNLGGYLGELHDQGQKDSSGRFTLDVTRSREVLRRYRLPSAWVFLTKVGQAAMLRGARWLKFDHPGDESGLRIEFEAPEFSPEELLVICESGLNLTRENGLLDMALALEGILRLGTISLRKVEIHSGEWLATVDVQGRTKLKQEPWKLDYRGTVVKVTYHIYAVLPCAFLQGWHITDVFNFAPIPVNNVGSLENTHPRRKGWKPKGGDGTYDLKLKGGSKHREVYLVAPDDWRLPIPGPAIGPATWHVCGPGGPRGQLDPPPMGPRFDWLRFDGEPALGCVGYAYETPYMNELFWVHGGALIGKLDSPPGWPQNWTGVLSAEGLQTDLSGCKLVENEAYQERMSWLTSVIHERY